MLGRLARRRDTSANFHKLSCEQNEEIERYLKADLGKGRADTGYPANSKVKAHWQPKHVTPSKAPPNTPKAPDRSWYQPARPWQNFQANQFHSKAANGLGNSLSNCIFCYY